MIGGSLLLLKGHSHVTCKALCPFQIKVYSSCNESYKIEYKVTHYFSSINSFFLENHPIRHSSKHPIYILFPEFANRHEYSRSQLSVVLSTPPLCYSNYEFRDRRLLAIHFTLFIRHKTVNNISPYTWFI